MSMCCIVLYVSSSCTVEPLLLSKKQIILAEQSFGHYTEVALFYLM